MESAAPSGAGFAEAYRQLFVTLRCPLGPEHTVGEDRLSAAERRVGVRAPAALRAYYLVAGGERRLNEAFNRLLPPEEWFEDEGYLVFLVENQSVVLWGTRAAEAINEDDPAVFQGVPGDLVEWHWEHDQVSGFLGAHLHWQASFGGGLPSSGGGRAAESTRETLDREWTFVGEVNAMRAYSKPGRSACLLVWDGADHVFVGTATAADLDAAVRELHLRREPSKR